MALGPFDDLVAQFAQEYQDSLQDQLRSIEGLVQSFCRQGHLDKEDMQTLHREVHSIKGTAPTFGQAFLGTIAHRFEDYLRDLIANKEPPPAGIWAYVDALMRQAERGKEPGSEQVSAILRDLPPPPSILPFLQHRKPIEALLVARADVQARMIVAELGGCGIRTTLMANEVQAIETALRLKPELILVSCVLERLSGLELLSVFDCLRATRSTPKIFLVSPPYSSEPDKQPRKGVPIVRKGLDFPDDFATAVTAIGLF